MSAVVTCDKHCVAMPVFPVMNVREFLVRARNVRGEVAGALVPHHNDSTTPMPVVIGVV